jgi:serine/threonine protein kinase
VSQVVILQETDERGAVHLIPVGGGASIGREAGANQIVVKDPHVSRTHCTLEGRPDGGVRVIDHGRTGTFVDMQRVEGEGVAGAGRKLRVGLHWEALVVGLLDVAVDCEGEPRPPCRLGPRYLLLGEVGRGGMGVVFEAWDREREQRCALKWLRVGGQATADDVARFTREATLQSSLRDYPGIARVFDYGTLPGSGELYCVLEFVDGESLEKKIRAGGLPREEGVRIVSRVARAIEYAHARGIIHRDLKPSNVLVNGKGMVRLTDFGIARTLDGSTHLTATGIMVGTPGFMAPEQIMAEKDLGPAVDVFGLGAVLYATLTGKAPTRGRVVSEVLRNAVAGTFDRPRDLDATIDEALERTCLRALAAKPAARHASAGALAEELEEWLRAHAPSSPVRLARPVSTRAPAQPPR